MDALLVKTLGITHSDDLGLPISTEVYISLIIYAAYAFVKNDYKPASFYARNFYCHAGPLFDKLYVRHMKQGK